VSDEKYAEVDVFISYARRDNFDFRVSALVDRLEQSYKSLTGGEELKVFWDTTQILGMEDWQDRILNGLHSARLLVTFLSPNYFASEICGWEFNEYLKHEAGRMFLGEGIAPIYIVEVPGGLETLSHQSPVASWANELCKRQYFDFREWSDGIAAAGAEPKFLELIGKLANQINERLSRARKFANCPGNVDRKNENFVDRNEELRRLRDLVRRNKLGVVTAVHGLGGIGKSALATEYAYTFAHEYPAGRWKVQCQGHDDLRLALYALAGARDLDFTFTELEKVDLDLSFERVLRELKIRAEQAHPRRVLLLLDDVDQAALLEPAQIHRLPRTDWLDVIVTTRLGSNELYGTQSDRAFLPVDELPENEALSLIEKSQPLGRFVDEPECAAARDIVRLLGGFTLAVEVTAVFLGQFAQDVTCSGFRDRLIEEGLSGLEKAGEETSEHVRHRNKSLKATMAATLERLSEPEKLAMSIASLLPSEHVVLPWLRALIARAFPEFGSDARPGYPDPWQGLLRRLFSLRLFQRTAENNVARMHGLLREIFSPPAESEFASNLTSALFSYAQARANFLWDGWAKKENRWEIPSLTACAWRWIEHGFNEGAYLANQISKPLKQLCRFAEAERLLRKAVAMTENIAGTEHPNVATALNNLAQLLHNIGKLEDVESLFRRSLEIDQHNFGTDHQTVARDLHNLAQYLGDANRLIESEEVTRRALAIYAATLGPNDPMVAICHNSLGRVRAARGDLEAAESNYRLALAIYQKLPAEILHEKYHSDFAGLLDNLAVVRQKQNRLRESEDLLRQALSIRKIVFSIDHPNIAQSLYQLGELYYHRGQYKKSECLYRRALANFEIALGPIHPNVAGTLSSLAVILKQTNRREEAEKKARRALEIDEKNYGAAHPRVAIQLNIIAAMLQEFGRFGDAEPLYRRAILINEESYGKEDSRVAAILNNLATLLQKDDRLGEGIAAMTRALHINETSLGPRHPKCAMNRNNLAEIYISLHRYSDALPLIEQALSILEDEVEKNHPDIAPCLDSLGRVYQAEGRYGEAETLQERAVLIREISSGPEHPETVMSLTNLAVTYQHLGKHAKAEKCFQRAIVAYERAYGPQNVDLATIINNLACLYYEQARYSEAEQLYLRSLDVWTNKLRPNHPMVGQGFSNIARLYEAEGRYEEAELAFKKAIGILVGAWGDQDQTARLVVRKYVTYLKGRGRNLEDILVLVEEIAAPLGANFRDLVVEGGSEK
jgi:tetratricopeptide (TPR) repeat protein